MTWCNPIGLELIASDQSMSFQSIASGFTALPLPPHPGAYAVQRKHHVHEGVDLYAPVGTEVYAVESGIVLDVRPFTGDLAGASVAHWENTEAVWIQSKSGVVLYGEIKPVVNKDQLVEAGQLVGNVVRVLKNDKGRPTSMLHLELHDNGSTEAPEWLDINNKPACLRDPTIFLLPLTKDRR